MSGTHLVPDGVVFAFLSIVLVEIDDIDGGLWVLLLLLLGDAVLLQHALPFPGEAGELARLVVDADVGDVHWVGGRGDGGAARRAQHAAHEGGKGALLLAAVGASLLGRLALVAVAIARAFCARWRGIHLAGDCVERGRLAQLGGAEARGLVGCERVLGALGATLGWAGGRG